MILSLSLTIVIVHAMFKARAHEVSVLTSLIRRFSSSCIFRSISSRSLSSRSRFNSSARRNRSSSARSAASRAASSSSLARSAAWRASRSFRIESAFLVRSSASRCLAPRWPSSAAVSHRNWAFVIFFWRPCVP